MKIFQTLNLNLWARRSVCWQALFSIKTDAYSQINKQLFTPFIFQRWFNSLEVEKKVKVQRNNLVFHWRKQEQKKKISLLKQLWWLELKIQETFLKIKRALETVCLEIFSLMIYFGLLTKSPGTRYTFFVKGKGPGNRNISWGLKGGEQISSLDLLFCKRKKPWHQKYLSFWKEKSLGTRYTYFFKKKKALAPERLIFLKRKKALAPNILIFSKEKKPWQQWDAWRQQSSLPVEYRPRAQSAAA